MNKKPRVLFIMHMPPPVHGSAMMGQYIYDSKIINTNYECCYINESLSSAVSDVGKFGMYKIRKIYNHFKNIANTVNEFKPDLVYITPSGYSPELAMIRYVIEFTILNRYHCKKLIHFHNKGDQKKCNKWWIRWYYKLLFKNSNVIFLSNLLVSQFEKYLRKDQILICPNGIPETLNYEPSAKRNNEIPHILFLSNLIETKGVIVLMDALKILKEKGYSFLCQYVGCETKDVDRTRFEKEVKDRNLDGLVSYAGKKYGEEKKIFFENSDIFVFPTFYPGETFGLVNLEAMEYKLPIISSNEGGIPDVVIDGVNGLVVDSSAGFINPEELAQKIKLLIDSPDLREKMGEEGYRIFKSQFTQTCFERKINELIDLTLKKE